MAFGDLIQSANNTSPATNSSITVTFAAAGVATAGNLLVANMCDNTGPSSDQTPSGWTRIVHVDGGTGDDRHTMYAKIAAGGETGVTITATGAWSAGAVADCAEFEGPWPATVAAALDQTDSNSYAVSSGGTICGPTSTTAQNDELVVASVFNRIFADSFSAWSDSFTEYSDNIVQDVCLGSAYKVLTATDTPTTTATHGAATYRSGLIATFKMATSSTFTASPATSGDTNLGSELQGVGIHKTYTPGIAQLHAAGFAPVIAPGRDYFITTGELNAVGFNPQTESNSIGAVGQMHMQGGTHQTHVTRQFFALLGQLRAQGMTHEALNAQTYLPTLGTLRAEGHQHTATVTVLPTTFNLTPITGEARFQGFNPQTIVPLFPTAGAGHLLGRGPTYIELENTIDGPSLGEVYASGFAPTVTVGQVRDYAIQLGTVGFEGLQQAINMHRTLDALVGRADFDIIAASVTLIQGGTITVNQLNGVLNMQGLQTIADQHKTGFVQAGEMSAQGQTPTLLPAGHISVEQAVGYLNHEGFTPTVDFDRLIGLVGIAHMTGNVPTVTHGVWTPVRKQAALWVAA